MTGRSDAGESATNAGVPIRWRGVLRDLVLVVAWVVIVTFAFGVLRWPSWSYYVVVFGGVLLYSLVGDPWAPEGHRR